MKRAGYVFLILMCAVPFLAAAQSSGAGFATQSVFLSKAGAVEGDSLLIYASVANASLESFTGTLVVEESEKQIGSVPVSLSSGEARVVAVPWRPTTGSHTLTARLLRDTGATVGETKASFTIGAAPVSVALSKTNSLIVEPSKPLEDKIEGLSPSAAAAAAPVLSAIDSARSKAAEVLDKQIEKTEPKLPGKNVSVLANTDAPKSPIAKTALGIIWTVYFYFLSVLRFLIGSIVFFYPIFVFLIFWSSYRLYRRMTRPSWER